MKGHVYSWHHRVADVSSHLCEHAMTVKDTTPIFSKRLHPEEIPIANLEQQLHGVRVALEWRFEYGKESFDSYMDRIVAFDQCAAPTDDASAESLEALEDALIESFPITDPLCSDAQYRLYLTTACLFLARAGKAIKQTRRDEAWYFVCEAEGYLGRASGHYGVASERNMMTARSSLGGKKKSANAKEKERKLYIQLLSSLRPPHGWKSKTEAVKRVSTAASPILENFGVAVDDTYARLSEMLSADVDMKAAFMAAQ